MDAEDLKRYVVDHRAPLREAMRCINDNWRELALVEDDEHRIVGLVTDGDLRRGLLSGLDLDAPVELVMSRNFRRVSPHAGRAQVVDIMRALNVRQVPVLDDEGRLVSIHFLRDFIGSPQKANTAVVMAGGKGTRLRPYTESCPKPMVLVAGRPILERIVLHLVGHGITDIFLSVNYLAEMIERHFGDGKAFGCSIRYLREARPLGTGGSLRLLPQTPAQPLIVMNGDQVTGADISKMLDFHTREGMEATIGVHPYSFEVPFGVVHAQGHRVAELVEKPVSSFTVSTGIYVLNPSALELIPDDGEEFPITALFNELLRLGRPVGCHRIDEDWLDVGNPRDLLRANGLG